MAPQKMIRPATMDDVPGLVDVFMAAFSAEYFQNVFPPNGPGAGYMTKGFTLFLQEGSNQECRLSVVEDDGKIVAGLVIWNVKAEDGGIWDWQRRWPEATEGIDKDVLAGFMGGMQDQHHEALGDAPHVYVEIVFVHPSYHKQGIGSSLVVHATSLADEQGVPAYLDAESKAVGIYQKAGFVLQSDVEKKSEMASMLRPAKGKEA